MKNNQVENIQKNKSKLNIWLVSLIASVVINISVFGFFAVDHQSRINPQFCASCHNMESHVDSYMSGNTMDNIHYKASVGCKDCHSSYTIIDETKSLIKYISGNYEKVFSPTKVDDEMCLQCHISLDYHAVRTDFLNKNPHQSHWPELRCTSCHLSHDEQEDYCSRCHENGGQRMTGEEITPRGHNPWAETSSEITELENSD